MRYIIAAIVISILFGSLALAATKPNYDQSPFGVNYLKWEFKWNSPGWEDEVRARAANMKAIGVYWDRDGISKDSVNPSHDGKTWVWDKTDKLVQICKEEKISLVVILAGNPTPRDEETRKQFAEYAYQIVNRYKDSVKIWEIWNEPNIPSFWKNPDVKLYTELVKAMYTAAKKADPTCTVIIGSTSGPGTDWFNGIYDNGGWDYCDGVSIHPYAMANGPIEQGLDKTLADLNKQFAAFGKPKPIWTTEVGWQGKSGPEEETQATRIVQTYVIHIANGIKNMAYFCMDNYDEWGFVTQTKPLKTKLAYEAIGRLTEALSPSPTRVAFGLKVRTTGSPGKCASFEGYLRMPEGVACYVFHKNATERVLILWSNDSRRREVDLAQKTGLSGEDIIGRAVFIADGKLTVGPTPVIVQGADERKIRMVSSYFNPYLVKKGQNVLINSSMYAESGKNPHGWAAGRFFRSDNKGTFATSSEGRNGSTCVSISNSTQPAAWDASPIPVYQGEKYRLTGWMKTQDATGKNVISIFWYNGNQWGVVDTVPTRSLTGTNDWTQVSVEGVVPRDAALVRVNLISENNTGTTWFDDVTLTLE